LAYIGGPELTSVQLSRIGKGMKFPDPISMSTGSVQVNYGYDRINQSIYNILATKIGSRLGNREFGSRLNELIFDQNDYVFYDIAEMYIRESIERWEPRVSIEQISFPYNPERIDANIVDIVITYSIKNSNIVVNMVYPYYR
jgi:hypothetical protein